MARTGKAVLCREVNKPVVVETVEIAAPKRDEVTLKIKACGVCHSDFSATNGTIPLPPPSVLGHEACGVIEEVGEGVTDLKVGDTAIVSWVAMCGECKYCAMGRPALCDVGATATITLPDGTSRLKDSNGETLNHFAGVSVMAEYATLHRDNIIRIDPDIPPAAAALVGCAVMTGVGAALNTAKVTPGSSVVVIGAGGIGLNVIQGAALAGAEKVIAVDMEERKLGFAEEFGATHRINPSTDGDVIAKVMELTGDGADYAFECIGLGATVTQTYNAIRKGGTAVVVGVSNLAETVTLGTFFMPFQEKVLTGSMYGSARPREDFPKLLGLYQAKKLKLDELVTATYSIDEAPQAFEDMQSGANARGVILF